MSAATEAHEGLARAGRLGVVTRELLAVAADLDRILVGVAASIASVFAWTYFHGLGVVLAYQDAVSHIEIARRVVDSPTTGFGQLGGVWLPLPHVLMLPFIWSDTLYYSGTAGSIVSMGSFVVTCVLIYKIVLDLCAKRVAALAGTLVFMLNPGVLYLQSTPMTELLMFACMAGIVYGLQRWARTDDYRYLYGSGLAALLGTLTRYEVWVCFWSRPWCSVSSPGARATNGRGSRERRWRSSSLEHSGSPAGSAGTSSSSATPSTGRTASMRSRRCGSAALTTRSDTGGSPSRRTGMRWWTTSEWRWSACRSLGSSHLPCAAA